ncbi:IS630 family transposase [Ktedonobacter racemifer]|uniref:IS630 family transposase n=1 Tax=Ktedonobacter racemifer TaxID=363277 RepID=UPI00058EDF6F|nr:IS630 family transposase [Ktedonobacter racemifer]
MSKKEPLPKDWREGRRLRGWQLYQQGWKQKDIADALGVTEGAVSQWVRRAKKNGPDGLRHQPPPGPQPKLAEEQRAQLPGLLAKGSEQYGFRGEVWTTARVAVLIKQQFGVRYHPAHCSRLLRAAKHSVQKPAELATQRNEEAIKAWKEEHWPSLKKSRAGKATDRFCR